MKTRLGGSPCPKDAPLQWRAPLCFGIGSGADINTGAADEDDRDLLKM
jgi:hypothetical protein